MDKINNIFVEALQNALIAECNNIDIKEHIFSKKFENKMSALIKRQKTPYYYMLNSTRKRVVCFIFILLLLFSATVLSFNNIRHAIADFFVNIFDTYSVVDTIQKDGVPQTIKDIYEITYDLSEFKKDVWDSTDTSYSVDYIKDNICISFNQHTKKDYNITVNTEDANLIEINISGYKAILYKDNHDYYKIIWENTEYIFSIFSNLDKDTLIKIAESVKK